MFQINYVMYKEKAHISLLYCKVHTLFGNHNIPVFYLSL